MFDSTTAQRRIGRVRLGDGLGRPGRRPVPRDGPSPDRGRQGGPPDVDDAGSGRTRRRELFQPAARLGQPRRRLRDLGARSGCPCSWPSPCAPSSYDAAGSRSGSRSGPGGSHWWATSAPASVFAEYWTQWTPVNAFFDMVFLISAARRAAHAWSGPRCSASPCCAAASGRALPAWLLAVTIPLAVRDLDGHLARQRRPADRLRLRHPRARPARAHRFV